MTGTPSTPRPVHQLGLSAADFDEQSGAEIVDRTKVSGDAVTPAAGGEAELLYRDCDFGPGAMEITVTVAGEGTVEVTVAGAHGEPTATLTPTPTAVRTTDTTARAPLPVVDGVHDVRLRLRGPLRLAHVGFSG